LTTPLGVTKNVPGLDVAVNHQLLVGVMDSRTDGTEQINAPADKGVSIQKTIESPNESRTNGCGNSSGHS
jgi:hypothetical protein